MTKPGTAVGRPLCGATRRQGGGPCRQPAGFRTPHPGEGRCFLHGGVLGKNLKHGRYSTTLNTEVRELVERFEADPDPLNVIPEVALARALLHDWLDRYERLRAALEAWNEAESDEAASGRPARPTRIPDLQEIAPLLEGISKIVARIEKARSDSAVSRADFYRVMTEMGRVVDLVVPDEEQRKRIHSGWMSIRLA